MKYSATVSKLAGCTGIFMTLKNEEKCGNLFTEEMKGIDKIAVLLCWLLCSWGMGTDSQNNKQSKKKKTEKQAY